MIKTPSEIGLENDELRAAAQTAFVMAGLPMMSLELERLGVKFADFVEGWIHTSLRSKGAPEDAIQRVSESWRQIVSGNHEPEPREANLGHS